MHLTYIKDLLIITLFIVSRNINSQEPEKKVKYGTDFKFEEGIYLNFNQVQNNHPVPKARIISTIDYNDDDFFDQVLNKKTITFFDAMGTKKEIKKEDIWGFSKNGILYINISGGFNRITIVGNICHFIATVTTYNTRYNDPYYNNPYYYPYYDPYRYRVDADSYENSELRQFIMSFQTGQVLEYETDNVKTLLMSDPELHDEFSNLKKRKQKQLKFLYIRKFNERNPLYLPVKNQ